MKAPRITIIVASAWIIGVFDGTVNGFIFGRDREAERVAEIRALAGSHPSGTGISEMKVSERYAVVIHELQELESQPLCHRTAARLLVSNCQVLDGKDESTVLTDSGRQIRDFVDFYAASLAICDLERGSFSIPTSCYKFREGVLAALPVPSRAALHVTSKEIDVCLSGLALSDSAWNTWVSYRHKSLRFCEAARVDHEKVQNIHVYQRITKIISNLADQVDAEIAERLAFVDKRAHEVSAELERLPAQIDLLSQRLAGLETFLSSDVLAGAEQSALNVRSSVKEAQTLQKMLSAFLQTVLNHNAEFAAAQDRAVELAAQKITTDMELVMNMLGMAISSSVALQQQIDHSQRQMVAMVQRQQALESNLDSILLVAKDMSSQYAEHQQSLDESRAKSESILGTLSKAEDSAGALQQSFSRRWDLAALWPYVFCPAATLVMGSYGLPPSAFRNMGLIAMGEVAGYVVSWTHTHSFPPLASLTPWLVGGSFERGNTSTPTWYPQVDLRDEAALGQYSNGTIMG